MKSNLKIKNRFIKSNLKTLIQTTLVTLTLSLTNHANANTQFSLTDSIETIIKEQNVDTAQAIKIKAKEVAETVKKTTYEKYGTASYYAHKFHGKKTANGERFNMYALTAAAANHIPMNCKIKVTNVENGKSVIVKVNDRGAFGPKYGRSLDLSKAAFSSIANLNKGVIKIKYEILD